MVLNAYVESIKKVKIKNLLQRVRKLIHHNKKRVKEGNSQWRREINDIQTNMYDEK